MEYRQANAFKFVNTILICLAFAFLAATICSNMYNPLQIIRGGEELVVPVNNDKPIEQPILLENTRDLHISLAIAGNINTDGYVQLMLTQGSHKEIVEIGVEQLDADRWVGLSIPFHFNDFENGQAIFSIKGVNISPDYWIDVLLTSGQQRVPQEFVSVDGETKENMYLVLSYGFFSWRVFFVFLGFWFGIAAISLFSIPRLICLVKTKPVFVAFVLYLLYECIKNRVWEMPLTDGWMTTPYLLDYSHGFISKALPGAVISLFTKKVSHSFLLILFFVLFLILSFSYLIFFIIWRKNAQNHSERRSIDITMVLFIASPMFITFYFTQWGRLEEICTVLFIWSALFIIIRGNKFLPYLVAVFSTIAVLTHQIFVFTLYPALLMLFIYQIVNNKRKDLVLPFIMNCVVPGAFCAYVQFMGSVDVPVSDFMAYLKTKSDISVLETMIVGEYYLPIAENAYFFGRLDTKRMYISVYLLVSLLFLTPLLYAQFKYWHRCIKHQDNMVSKLITIALALIPLASIPMFLTICDYGRIVMLLVCEQIILIGTLCMIDRRVFWSEAVYLYETAKKKYGSMIWYILAGYISILGKGSFCYVIYDNVITQIVDWLIRFHNFIL